VMPLFTWLRAWPHSCICGSSSISCHSSFFFSSRRRHTRWPRDWSSDVCSSDLTAALIAVLTGCGLGRQQFRDEHTDQVAVTEVQIVGGSGSVVVRSGAEGSVTVKRHVWYTGEKPGVTSRVDGSVLKIHTGCPRQCSI